MRQNASVPLTTDQQAFFADGSKGKNAETIKNAFWENKDKNSIFSMSYQTKTLDKTRGFSRV